MLEGDDRVVLTVRVRRRSRDRLDVLAAAAGVDRSEAARRVFAAGLPVVEAGLPGGPVLSLPATHEFIQNPMGSSGECRCRRRRRDPVHDV